MKALILAGGYARRLAPITDFIAKPLLPIGGRPIIDWIVEKIRDAGIREIAVSTNRYYESQFRYWMRCAGEDISLIVEPTTSEEEKFGAIRGMRYAMDIMGEDDYLIVAGDNFFDFSLREFVERFEKVNKPLIAVYDVESLEKARRFGTVILGSDGKVIKLVEKPPTPETTLISTACYAFPAGIRARMDEYLSGRNNPDSPGYFISWLAGRETIYGHVFRGVWMDIGNLDEYRRAFQMFYH